MPFVCVGGVLGLLPALAMCYFFPHSLDSLPDSKETTLVPLSPFLVEDRMKAGEVMDLGQLLLYAIAFGLVGLFDSLATAPYAALIPDIVSSSQFGKASGWMGLMAMCGSLVGGGLVGWLLSILDLNGCYLFLLVLLLSSMVATVFVLVYWIPPCNHPRVFFNFPTHVIMGSSTTTSATTVTTASTTTTINQFHQSSFSFIAFYQQLTLTNIWNWITKPFDSRNFRFEFFHQKKSFFF
jgi:MFS family permease